ncbi:MAG: 3,4-dehydroadipyl-CoA semialdehyde dehydrogenase [Acidobacteriota bacterium]
MKTLKSYVCGRWHEANRDFASLYDPSTEQPIARASSAGIDFPAVLAFARERGGPALRALSFVERAALLKEMSKALRERREELLELSALVAGATRPDGAFDLDGGGGTLAYYAAIGRGLGSPRLLAEGDSVQLGKSEAFCGRHALAPRRGVAVLVNAFNFPAWGFAEKAACALLAGMPVVVKPATSTAWVTERCVEILIEAAILPEGALQLVCGSTGDLLERLGPQDVLAFTGSAATALRLRGMPNLLAASTRINVEADSLNAAVLAPDATAGSPTFELFVRDVVREMTQKSGQKCTAVRRILVPTAELATVEEALVERLRQVVTGNPADPGVSMGPLSTAQQLADAVAGVATLRGAARLVHGGGTRCDGQGSPAGKGYFFGPTLLFAENARAAAAVHSHEVFAPVATLLPYSGSAQEAGEIVALGGGTLVTSIYSDDPTWRREMVVEVAPWTGRVYCGSQTTAPEANGSGMVLPQTLHGGPGRAGGGEELAGLAGLRLYQQKVALQGARAELAALLEA